MDHLPNDPAILVSSVNMLLRDDEYDTLQLKVGLGMQVILR